MPNILVVEGTPLPHPIDYEAITRKTDSKYQKNSVTMPTVEWAFYECPSIKKDDLAWADRVVGIGQCISLPADAFTDTIDPASDIVGGLVAIYEDENENDGDSELD